MGFICIGNLMKIINKIEKYVEKVQYRFTGSKRNRGGKHSPVFPTHFIGIQCIERTC